VRRAADLEIEGERRAARLIKHLMASLRLRCIAGMVAQAGSAEQAMPKELTLDGEGRLAERERPGEVRSSMQNLGRSRREALTLSCHGRHRPRFPAYCNGGLAMMPSLIHRSFFLQFHEYEPCRLLSQHTAQKAMRLHRSWAYAASTAPVGVCPPSPAPLPLVLGITPGLRVLRVLCDPAALAV
jgi:hypothetical protein